MTKINPANEPTGHTTLQDLNERPEIKTSNPPATTLPMEVSAAEINQQNKRFWSQQAQGDGLNDVEK
jgi:hypothetical protein